MQNTNITTDFRKFLEQELIRRNQESARFSLRAFARQLEVDSSFLSKILNGKRTVTMRTIRMFGERLNLSPDDMQKFSEFSREKKLRRKLDKMLARVPVEDREHSTISIHVDENRLKEAREKIKSFRNDLAQFLNAEPAIGKTYQISVSVFPVAEVSPLVDSH
jgi:transcriptional regulator with XRE-family HTH domain